MLDVSCLYVLQDQPAGGFLNMLPLILGFFVIMYFVVLRPQMKEQKKRKAMLASIKKHDRVLTTGGIYGVVVSVGDSEVVLKIDDNSNVRVKFARSAVSAIVSKEEKEAATS